MKHESLFLKIQDFDLTLFVKTQIREVAIWKVWIGNEKSTLEKIKEIADDDKKAVLYFKDENKIVSEFAQIKVLEFPHEKIDTTKVVIEEISETVIIQASQLL